MTPPPPSPNLKILTLGYLSAFDYFVGLTFKGLKHRGTIASPQRSLFL